MSPIGNNLQKELIFNLGPDKKRGLFWYLVSNCPKNLHLETQDDDDDDLDLIMSFHFHKTFMRWY